jgi:hypothetical protein
MKKQTENIKRYIRLLNWDKLKKILDALPATEELLNEVAFIAWHTDTMVRRRPDDDGDQRDKLLEAIGKYFQARGVASAVELISAMHAELKKIDAGYVAIHSLVPQMVSAKFSAEQRISGMFAALDHGVRSTLQDIEKKIQESKGVMGPERNLRDAAQNVYDPHAVLHGHSLAGGDVLMLEAFRQQWFDDKGNILLPELEAASPAVTEAVVANLLNANTWRMWKSIDERVRFLGGSLIQFSQDFPEWVAQLKTNNPGVQVNTAFEFKPDVGMEQYDIIANERLDTMLVQNLHQLVRGTNVVNKIAAVRNKVGLPPSGLVSLDEAHAAVSLSQMTKLNILQTTAGEMLLSERLRGYAVLKLLVEELEKEQGSYFPRVARSRLITELQNCGLTAEVAECFLDKATFRKSSRDLYDQPLIKAANDDYYLFGTSLVLADLTKTMISCLSNEGHSFSQKGKIFEDSIISLLKKQNLNARTLKVRRGPKNEEYDYDVAFTWGDYVFFFECKNRGIPMGNPIALYHFNNEMSDHVMQVVRLRQGLIDHPDILEKNFKEAVGKTPVFCIVNALPYSVGKFEDIYVIDDSMLGRFFKSSTFGVTLGRQDGKGPQIRQDIREIWSGSVPTASEFIEYIRNPPQLKLALDNYKIEGKVDRLSLDTFVAAHEFKRNDLDAEGISQSLRES